MGISPKITQARSIENFLHREKSRNRMRHPLSRIFWTILV